MDKGTKRLLVLAMVVFAFALGMLFDSQNQTQITSAQAGDGHSLDAADGNPTDAVFVDNDGRVGIGTTSPVQKLHISDPADARLRVSAGEATFQFESQGTFSQMGNVSNHDLHFYTNNTRRAVITNGGNVGIGTTRPAEKLDVEGNIHLSGLNPKITSNGEICIGSGCP
jgi:hypothetical protein